MIFYTSGGIWYLLKLFQMKGSVFPASLATAMPCGCIAAGLRWLINEGQLPGLEEVGSILTQTQAWAGFSFLVGFLIVFRTSQAYSRFWDGCTSTHAMRAEWFDACSALVSFCAHSTADQKDIMYFKHTLIRLFSMLHASALADLEDLNNTGKEDDVTAFTYELIDPAGLDDVSLEALRVSEARVELIFEWIQLLIVTNINTGVLSIPAPILSRAFQEIASGMVAFHDSVKISYIPFPFPYAQNCDFLLLLHWVLAPFVFTQWVTEPWWAFVMVFIQVFVLWSLNFIAVEIENPFGNDKNDLDGHHMQCEMNRHLLLLLKPSTMRLPSLKETAIWSSVPSAEVMVRMDSKRESFVDVWRGRCNSDWTESAIARKENAFVRARRNSLGSDGRRPSVVQTEQRVSALNGNRDGEGSQPLSHCSVSGAVEGSRHSGTRENSEAEGAPVHQAPALHGRWETLPKAPWPIDIQAALPASATCASPAPVALLSDAPKQEGTKTVLPGTEVGAKLRAAAPGPHASPDWEVVDGGRSEYIVPLPVQVVDGGGRGGYINGLGQHAGAERERSPGGRSPPRAPRAPPPREIPPPQETQDFAV